MLFPTHPRQALAGRRAGVVVALIAALLLASAPGAAHAGERTYEVAFASERPVTGAHTHVVEPGEYLSTIAAAYGLDASEGWRVLYDANEEIEDPDLILVGDEVVIPEEGETLASRPLTAVHAVTAGGGAEGGDDAQSGSDSVEAAPASGDDGGSGDSTQESSAVAPAAGNSVWDRLAACESGGDWSINTGNGYYGGLQFDKSSWDWAGGGKHAAYAHQASRAQQIEIAERLLEIHPAGWGAWPACASKLGLR